MDRLTINHDIRQHGSFIDYPPEIFERLRRTSEPFDLECSLTVVNDSKHEPGHTYNCGACAVAFDMRIRGYDVIARLKSDGTNVGDLASYYYKRTYYQPFATEYPDNVLRGWNKYTGHCKQLRALKRKGRPIAGTRTFKKVRDSYETYCNSIESLRWSYIDKLRNRIRDNVYGEYGIIILGFICSENPHKRTDMFHAVNYYNGHIYDAQEGCEYEPELADLDPREIFILPTRGLGYKDSVVDLVASRR